MPDSGFPNRTDRNFIPKSDPTEEYNCVGWALHTQHDFIWPDQREQFSWPIDLPRVEDLTTFRNLFEMVGFQACSSTDYENGFEKIAIYANADGPQHVARQLPTGRWTSKMGERLDAEHSTVDVLAGPGFGQVVLIMRRPYNGMRPQLPALRPPRPRLITAAGSPLLR